MEVTATHRYARVSAQKARLYRPLVKKLSVQQALDQLAFLPGNAPKIIRDVLASAVANAVANHGLSAAELVVADVVINSGVFMKRFRPVSRGRAFPFKRRTAHVTVIVEPKAALPTPSLPEAPTKKTKAKVK